MLVDLQDSVCGFKIKTVHDFLKKHFGYAREAAFVDLELAPRYFGKKGGDVLDELISRGWLERKTEGTAELYDLCVPKVRFCHIDGEGRQGQVVRRRRRGAQSRDGEERTWSEIDRSSTH